MPVVCGLMCRRHCALTRRPRQANMRRYRTQASLNRNSERRRMIVEELYETEKHYVNNLRTIVHHYEQPLRTLFQLSLKNPASASLAFLSAGHSLTMASLFFSGSARAAQ